MTATPTPAEAHEPAPAKVLANIAAALGDGTAAEYAATLANAGFTVYLANPAAGQLFRRVRGWFHYSRTVDGVECYGIYYDGSDSFEGAHHSMPITPSRLNGSGAIVGAKWGDPDTLGMDDLAAESVEMARIVARPANWCPYNAEPTPEAVRRANGHNGVGQKFYRGAILANAKPWGIGSQYLPAAEWNTPEHVDAIAAAHTLLTPHGSTLPNTPGYCRCGLTGTLTPAEHAAHVAEVQAAR